MRRKVVGIAGIAALAAVTGLGLEAQPRSSSGQWRSVGGDPAFTRYSPLDQINKNNVKTLKIAWRQAGYDPALKTAFPELRVSGNYRSTPIMIDGVLYAPNAVGLVRAFGPAPARSAGSRRRSRRPSKRCRGPARAASTTGRAATRSGCSWCAASTSTP